MVNAVSQACGDKRKVIGIGLNKTATKSLAHCFDTFGYRNHSYSLEAFKLYQRGSWPELFRIMDKYDSFEDWPWPLMYQKIEEHYPDARFILTVRKNPQLWYRSLCKMSVRMGPLNDFEKPIYGYAMPQEAKDEHLAFYDNHNFQVRSYFADKPHKLHELCFDEEVDMNALCCFLDEPVIDLPKPHINRSASVYSGENLWLAHLNRLQFQTHWYGMKTLRAIKHQIMAHF